MRKNAFLTALAIAACAGCATQPVADPAAAAVPAERVIDSSYLAAKPGCGQVTLKRDRGFSGSACTSRVFVNAKPIADLKPAEKIVLHLAPGEYVFGAWPNGICGGGMAEVHGTVRADQEIAFRIRYGSNFDYTIDQTAF